MDFNKDELMEYFLVDNPDNVMDKLLEFNRLMMKYRSAIREVTTKLEVLNDELSLYGNRNPIEDIQSRIKTPVSIAEKLKRLGKPVNMDEIMENLNDVAGIRVICPFIQDIYRVADMLTRQDDITVIKVKDYIKNPKENGYRSYHLIVEVPVFFSDVTQPMRVEVQIRTVAMNFWASLEHQIRYKKDIEDAEKITKELKECADIIAVTDEKMQKLKDKILGEMK
ncbi:GTP pyrophosphokinase [Lachnoclostridium sp. An181]|uniref:GTP pyrophosphokinase n=1 Tax=Lachnoclostridium sp. An181 TaxID=1965575 RepID=UPI000B385154|nr:GTP pyrophosphokinase family protein [Lachnoclostridium sp. An181]OUP51037.1 GTP pyrophosphokinase [Lachnoclostridium sp. An181]